MADNFAGLTSGAGYKKPMSTQDIIDAAHVLEERHGDMHFSHRHLRNFWNGHVWLDEQTMSRSLVSVFRDLRHGEAAQDREPDVKMTLPFIEVVVSKFMAMLADPPQVSFITPPPGYADLRKEETRRALADQNEKFIYGLWEQNRIRRHFAKTGFYLPLFGCAFHGLHPDFKSKTMRYLTRSPEHAYPVWDINFDHLEALCFIWETPADIAERTYGTEVLAYASESNDGGMIDSILGAFGARKPKHNAMQVIEWWDGMSKVTIIGGKEYQRVDHMLGFCPWEMSSFYEVPEESFGKGVIEGNIQLFQKLNMLDSLELQSIIENVFARLVIVNPAVAPEDIDNGPGGVIPVGQGGDVKWLAPPEVTTDLTRSMTRSMDFMQRGTHLPGSMYGEGVASSITTGKAQHESMLPTGNIIDYVQGNIGEAWNQLNSKAIDMTEHFFANRKVTYFGHQYTNSGWAAALERPKVFQIEVKGKDLKSWTRHDLTFMPQLSMHEKIVMGLQMAGGGLVSRRWQRDQIGITDNDAMDEEILAEKLQDIRLQGWVALVTNGGATPDQVENALYAMEKGAVAMPPQPGAPGQGGIGAPAIPGLPTAPAGAPAPGAPLPPPGPPATPPQPGIPDLTQTLGQATPPGAAPRFPGIPHKVSQNHYAFTLRGAIGDFGRIKKLKGDVYLIGKIVQRDGTDGPVEVAITNKLDKQTIINALPDEYHGHIQFRVVTGTPTEQHIQVGPGHAGKAQKKGAPHAPHPNNVTAETGGIVPVKGAAAGGPGQGSAPPFGSNPNQVPAMATSLPTGGPGSALTP